MTVDEADFIIVGGGTAGCVLANRLTANGRYRVVLIEAGGRDRNPWFHIPIGYGRVIGDPRYDWRLSTVAEAEANGRVIAVPRGKVLGGSSSTNGLLYVRGQPEDYDEWEDLGATGWSYVDLLPYFRRSEDYEFGADAWHGAGGELGVSGPRDRHPLCEAWIAAGGEVGIPPNQDFNGPRQEGVGYYHVTARNGRRSSTSVAFLKPARGRTNLRIITRAVATRIRFDGLRAIGLDYESDGESRHIRARKEIILAAGAIASPQLLMCSGVGDAAALGALGIPVVADRPGVGRDLVDHANVRLNYRASQPCTLSDTLRTPWGKMLVGMDYLLRRRGPLTVSAGYGAAFYRTREVLQRPDFQGYLLLFRTDATGKALEPFSSFMTSGYQLRPESRGSIALASPDPRAMPLIHANYLGTESDRNVTLAGIKKLRAILRAPAIAPFVASSEIADDADDETLMAYIRAKVSPGHHFAGSCRMGGDDEAVVDARLKVRGVEGLRVVDASIMPTMISGNTCAPVIMIAEKGADMILEDAIQAPARAAEMVLS